MASTSRAKTAARNIGSGVAPDVAAQSGTTPIYVTPGQSPMNEGNTYYDPGTGKFIASGELPERKGGRINISGAPITVSLFNDPDPIYRPYLLPGVPGISGQTASLGSITPFSVGGLGLESGDDPSNQPLTFGKGRSYGFKFHWNPQSISYSTPADWNQAAKGSLDIGKVLFINNGALSFQFMIERMEEAAVNHATSNFVLGSRNFADLGTMYDIEYLYRTINGEPQHKDGVNDALFRTANYGFLYANAVRIHFNQALDYACLIQNIDIDHQKFTSQMVPTLSYVTISATMLNTQTPDSAPGDTSTPTTSTPTDSKSAKIAQGEKLLASGGR